MIIPLRAVRNDLTGFEELLHFHKKTEDCFADDVTVDMSNTSWFDADMCAPFGAILYKMGESLNSIEFTGLQEKVQEILLKNGFLSYYGHSKAPDKWATTIPYHRFAAKDDRYFASYIEEKLMHRAEIPRMSEGLQKKFRENIFEIFNNAVTHSQTKLGIFTCGQFYPKRHEINFAVADLGIGIWQNVKEHTGMEMAPEDAIDWATEGQNTTRKGQIPGGLGLKLLREFIDLNGGSIQIVSQTGYWKREKKITKKLRLNREFPGTVVNVKINTADANSYCLKSELSEDDIF